MGQLLVVRDTLMVINTVLFELEITPNWRVPHVGSTLKTHVQLKNNLRSASTWLLSELVSSTQPTEEPYDPPKRYFIKFESGLHAKM